MRKTRCLDRSVRNLVPSSLCKVGGSTIAVTLQQRIGHQLFAIHQPIDQGSILLGEVTFET